MRLSIFPSTAVPASCRCFLTPINLSFRGLSYECFFKKRGFDGRKKAVGWADITDFMNDADRLKQGEVSANLPALSTCVPESPTTPLENLQKKG